MKDQEPRRRLFQNKLSLLIPPLVIAAAIEGRVLLDRKMLMQSASLSSSQPILSPLVETVDISRPTKMDPAMKIIADRQQKDLDIAYEQSIILRGTLIDERRAQDLYRRAQQHIIDGVYLAKLILPVQDAASIEISSPYQSIQIFGRRFDLDHPSDPHILNAIITEKIAYQEAEVEKKRILERAEHNQYININEEIANMQKEQVKSQQAVDDLLWLYDQNLPIFVDKDAFAILPPDRVRNLARTLRVMQENGLPFPRKISYVRYKEGMVGGGWYADHNHPLDTRFTITVTNGSGAGAITHELGHFVSDAVFFDPANQKLYEIAQGAYENEVHRLLSDKQDVEEEAIAADRKQPNLVEDYAATFEMFLLHGDEFRTKMEWVKRENPAAYEVLSGKYAFMKELFGGGEFFRGGNPAQRQYDFGSFVSVRDSSERRPGIILRQDRPIEPQDPAVFDGDVVEIIDGPQIFRGNGSNDRRERNYWRIRVAAVGEQNTRLIEGSSLNKEGLMPDDFFGSVIQPEELELVK